MFMTLSEKEEVAILRMSKMAETGGDLALIILIFARNIAKKIDNEAFIIILNACSNVIAAL